MEEAKYIVEQQLTEELYYEISWLTNKKIHNYAAAIAVLIAAPIGIALICLWTKTYWIMILFFALAVILPILFYLSTKSAMRKAWKSSQTTQNITIQCSFYDTYYTVISDRSSTKTRYEELYGIIQSDRIIGLLSGNHQGVAIEKKNCPDEVITFLKEKTDGKIRWIA